MKERPVPVNVDTGIWKNQQRSDSSHRPQIVLNTPSLMLTTSRRMKTMYQPRFRDCHAEHSNQHPIPFVLSLCLSVHPSLCFPPSLFLRHTPISDSLQYRQQPFPNTTSHRFYFPFGYIPIYIPLVYLLHGLCRSY